MLKVIKHFFIWLLITILMLIVCLVGLVFIFEQGPSESIRDLFVVTVMQTSAAKPAATLFLDQETVDAILAQNDVKDAEVVSDGSMVSTEVPADPEFDINAVTIEDVKGPTYYGKVMIVNDPSRIYVYALPEFGVPRGKYLTKICAEENALGGVNGGGFEDINGMGKGGTPLGIVISKGVYRNGDKYAKHRIIGFDNDNKLVVGTMTGNEAINAGVRDAVEWGPALIVNGEVLDVGETGGGYNPRTAIGQRPDGSVVMVVIDGRQPDSLGASYNDLQDIMLNYGCVNAANLDGGLSSTMSFEGETVNRVYSLYGERPIPTAVLVRRVSEDAQQ